MRNYDMRDVTSGVALRTRRRCPFGAECRGQRIANGYVRRGLRLAKPILPVTMTACRDYSRGVIARFVRVLLTASACALHAIVDSRWRHEAYAHDSDSVEASDLTLRPTTRAAVARWVNGMRDSAGVRWPRRTSSRVPITPRGR